MKIDVSSERFSIPGVVEIPESLMPAFADAFADRLGWPSVVYLQGDLGAGKTTFARHLLKAFGVSGSVKSPTYTLLETYQIALGQVCHFDLYRLQEPSELEYLGARDLFSEACLVLVEWPQRAAGELPQPDWTIEFSHSNDTRRIITRKAA